MSKSRIVKGGGVQGVLEVAKPLVGAGGLVIPVERKVFYEENFRKALKAAGISKEEGGVPPWIT